MHETYARPATLQAQPATTNVTTQITALSLTNINPVYGQSAGHGTRITVPQGSPVPQGNIVFLNGSSTLATASLTGAGAVINGNNVVGGLALLQCYSGYISQLCWRCAARI